MLIEPSVTGLCTTQLSVGESIQRRVFAHSFAKVYSLERAIEHLVAIGLETVDDLLWREDRKQIIDQLTATHFELALGLSADGDQTLLITFDHKVWVRLVLLARELEVSLAKLVSLLLCFQLHIDDLQN